MHRKIVYQNHLPTVLCGLALSALPVLTPIQVLADASGAKQPPVQQLSPTADSASPSGARVNELFNQAAHLLKVNRAFEARALLEQALVLAPRSAGVHCNLGLAYENSGNLDKAIDEFKAALALSAHMPEATLNLAGCYQSQGENLKAIAWYETYVKENPRCEQFKQVQDIIRSLKEERASASSAPSLPDYLANVTAEGKFRWSRQKMPIRVYIEMPVGPMKNFGERFKRALIQAFDDWCEASDGRLIYKIVSKKEDADIYCAATSNPKDVAEDGKESERGSARVVVRGEEIERAQLKILSRPLLEDGLLSDDEILKACLHEVGHVLGLQGHSTNNHDVMFFTVDTATVWPVLSKRDRATIEKLYK